jgi:hypothetical protein
LYPISSGATVNVWCTVHKITKELVILDEPSGANMCIGLRFSTLCDRRSEKGRNTKRET